MADKISVPRGTNDILPDEAALWQFIEEGARRLFNTFNYNEIRTPVFEEARLFKRSLGQTSDVVNKQLLELKSSKEDGYALRPEGTASIVRSYIENRLDKKEGLTKLYYIGPMFRGERPQKGRLRQFHQIGAEIIGPNAGQPLLDVEIIALCMDLLKIFGVQGAQLVINTLGTAEDKENLSALLRERLKDDLGSLCDDCRSRFERNVFRILDCKNDKCKKTVAKLELDNTYLCQESRDHFQTVKDGLDTFDIDYHEDPKLVRGLDYYTHTVFEITHDKLGSQDAICAGGRYNQLVAQLGGADVPAIGFALGIERAILAVKKREAHRPDVLNSFIIALDEPSLKRGFEILREVRAAGIKADMSLRQASVKSLMREADKSGARHVIIIGEKELKNNAVTIKNMTNGEQKEVGFSDLFKALKD